ncbi:glutamine amidotransferase [Thermomonas sp. S9]|nr:glutamine amidotransferase [Thermomonas sp. S9]
MHAPFLILQTGHPTARMRRHGSFAHWIRVAAGLERDAAVVVDVEHGEALPERAGFAGVIVTGSAAMVTEHRDWSERSAVWLAEAAQAGLPLLGICYGHQLIAHALGGEVGDNPRGREMGTVAVERLPEAAADPLFAGLPARFAAQATHLQSVLRPPAGAVVLARNDHDACHAFRWGSSAWGCSSIPSSARCTCAATSAPVATRCARKAAIRASSKPMCTPRRWPGACCGASCGTRAPVEGAVWVCCRRCPRRGPGSSRGIHG